MNKPIKLIQSEKTRQWHSNIIGPNGKILYTSEPVKRKAFAVKTVKSAAKVFFEMYALLVPADIEKHIQYFPAPKKTKQTKIAISKSIE